MASRGGWAWVAGIVVVAALYSQGTQPDAVADAAAGQRGGGPCGGGSVADVQRDLGLSDEQIGHAATITRVGLDMDMPHWAVVVALATAMQESTLHNYGHLGDRNDHDSQGLFQQRPSQGWGTVEQVTDPVHASRSFYRTLRKVEGWQDMRITDAAQRVQRSAFPNAYQKWADDAEQLAGVLIEQCG